MASVFFILAEMGTNFFVRLCFTKKNQLVKKYVFKWEFYNKVLCSNKMLCTVLKWEKKLFVNCYKCILLNKYRINATVWVYCANISKNKDKIPQWKWEISSVCRIPFPLLLMMERKTKADWFSQKYKLCAKANK